MGNAFSIRRNSKSGFSLVELMIVIAIMAVLAIVVIPAVTSYLGEAKEETTKTNLTTLKNEVNHYIRKVGRPPQILKDLVRKPAGMSRREWGGPYLQENSALKDGWDNPFVYKINPDGHPPYKLYSWGDGGVGGPEDEWIYPS